MEWITELVCNSAFLNALTSWIISESSFWTGTTSFNTGSRCLNISKHPCVIRIACKDTFSWVIVDSSIHRIIACRDTEPSFPISIACQAWCTTHSSTIFTHFVSCFASHLAFISCIISESTLRTVHWIFRTIHIINIHPLPTFASSYT